MKYSGSNQRVSEYSAWTSLCIGLGARTYVELGCGSSHEQAKAGIRVVTVDLLPNGISGISHVQGDTHDPVTRDRVLGILGTPPDIVFIDADHAIEAVRADFNLWYPVTTMAIGFHDILMDGVSQFWNEVKRQYPSVEIIARDVASANDWQRGSGSNGDLNVGGIGVIFK